MSEDSFPPASFHNATDNAELNPWFSIWMRPRETMRQILNTDPERQVLVLAAISGIGQTLNKASQRNLGDAIDVPVILFLALILGSIGGIIQLYISGALISWTGKWIEGQADSLQVRAALAWSSIPGIWLMLFWIPELALFGEEMFTEEMPVMESNSLLSNAFIALGLVSTIGAVWSIVVMLKCLAEAQGFNAWKALANIILAFCVVFLPLLAIGSLFIAIA